jgi:Uma2 family endonuclease
MPKRNAGYTYADYCTWDDGERWELIEGIPYAMSPAPSQRHQEVCGELHWQIKTFLKGKPCKVFAAPFDVRLNAAGDDDTVCQPDLLVVCDAFKLDGKCCKGAPDLVVEVLSPSTARHDRMVKLRQYRRNGVREYWIVDPETKTVQVNVLENGKYVISMYGDEDTAPVGVLEGCEIDLADVFAE